MLAFGQVVAEIDEAAGPRPGRLREEQRRAPVGVDGRVERRLVRLVLGEQLPSVGERVVDLAQAVGDALELAPEVRLAGMVRAVGEPDGECGRAELHAELDDVAVVLDRRLASARVGRSQRPNL